MNLSPDLTRDELADLAERALKTCPDLDDGDAVFFAIQRGSVPVSSYGRDTIETAIERVRARRAKLQACRAEAA